MKATAKNVETKMVETLKIHETTFEIAKTKEGWKIGLMGMAFIENYETAEKAKDAIRENIKPELIQAMHIIAFRVAENLENIKAEMNE